MIEEEHECDALRAQSIRYSPKWYIRKKDGKWALDNTWNDGDELFVSFCPVCGARLEDSQKECAQ